MSNQTANQPSPDPRYDLWEHILDTTGFTAVDDDLNTIITLALRTADEDQLRLAGLQRIPEQ